MQISHAWVSLELMYVQWLQVQSLPLPTTLSFPEWLSLLCKKRKVMMRLIKGKNAWLLLFILLMLVCTNQLLKCPPYVAAHKLICKILIALLNSLQKLSHLCFHFNIEAVQAIKIKKNMEIWHCLRKGK